MSDDQLTARSEDARSEDARSEDVRSEDVRSAVTERLAAAVRRVVYGADRTLELLITALVAGGHVLIEDVPGTGKTRLATALARSLGVTFRRVQCTPDLLPGDILGTTVYRQDRGAFEFQRGPIFTHVLLVDEINRATPRTQSAFLEAMQEGSVSVDGVTHRLSPPFLVIATQNPVDLEGTFPLPEAQLDRFLMRARMPYPPQADEVRIVRAFGRSRDDAVAELEPVVSTEDLFDLQRAADRVELAEPVAEYVVAIVRATRSHASARLGGSPRAAVALARAARARAALAGRGYVIPDDVKAVADAVLSHRLLPTREAELRGETAAGILRSALDQTPVPVEDDATGEGA